MRFVKTLLVPGCILAVLALTLAGNVAPALADNLISNGNFETGDLTDWLVFGQSPSSDVFVQSPDNGPSGPGMYNAYMVNRAEAQGLTLKQSTPIGSGIPGATTYSVDLKLDEADIGGVLFVQIFAEQDGVGIVGGSGLMGPYWPWGAWQTFSGSFVAPAGTDFLTIQIMANTGANIGTSCVAHVDNVILDQGTVAAEEMNWSDIKALYR